jgi:hypothetical protein
VANDVVGLEALTRKLLGALQKYGVPAVGFVNEGKLFVEGAGRDEVDGLAGPRRWWRTKRVRLSSSTDEAPLTQGDGVE